MEYLNSEEEPFSYTRDFQRSFCKITIGEHELVQTLQVYLTKVEQILATMEGIFPSHR